MLTVDGISGLSRIKLILYRFLFIPLKVFKIRHKKQIEVVFILSELGVWKTESLFLKMLMHPRLSPRIAVVNSTENSSGKSVLIEYLIKKGYQYVVLGECDRIYDHFKADIIFYQKPYMTAIPENQRYRYNYHSLFCYVTYGISTIFEKWAINQPIQLYAWQNYQFNDSCSEEFKMISLIKGKNFIVTGFPMSDMFLHYKSERYTWKNNNNDVKKIIWAPHHTLPQEGNLLNYSTFLAYSQVMLDLAKEYSDKVQISFKPHPLLRPKLEVLWGKDETDRYYMEWADGYNTQFDDGDYVDLFMQSDALIHDCSSFIVEYFYTGKPALFLDNGSNHKANMLEYTRDAFDLQYTATSLDDIKEFVNNLINSVDPRKEEREDFFRKYLIPPGESACTNIINSILGTNRQVG